MQEHRNFVLIHQTTIPGSKQLSYEIEMPGDELAFCSIYTPRVWDGRDKFELCFKADFCEPENPPAPFDVVKPSSRGWYGVRSHFRPVILPDEEVVEQFVTRYNERGPRNESDRWIFEPFNVKVGVDVYSYRFGDRYGTGFGLRYIKVGLLR